MTVMSGHFGFVVVCVCVSGRAVIFSLKKIVLACVCERYAAWMDGSLGQTSSLGFPVTKRWEPLGGTFLCLVCLKSDACLGTFFKGQFCFFYFGMRLQ